MSLLKQNDAVQLVSHKWCRKTIIHCNKVVTSYISRFITLGVIQFVSVPLCSHAVKFLKQKWNVCSFSGKTVLTFDVDVSKEFRAIFTKPLKQIPPPWNEDGKGRQTERPDVGRSESGSCEQENCSGTLELQVVRGFNRRWHGAAVSERGDGFWQDGH